MRMTAAITSIGFVLLMGCAPIQKAGIRPPTESELHSTSETKHVVDRNYTLGVERSAYVGQSVVKVKDYTVEQASSDAAFKSTEAITASWWMAGGDVTAPAGTDFRIVGMVDAPGKTYFAIQFPNAAFARSAMLVDSAGNYAASAFAAGIIYQATDPTGIHFTPTSTKFVRPTTEHVSKQGGYINFEIVYSGTSKDSLNLLYREYTPDDLVRPAFSQNLTYARDSSTIRFRDVLIHVIRADNEQLTYIVQQDGLATN